MHVGVLQRELFLPLSAYFSTKIKEEPSHCAMCFIWMTEGMDNDCCHENLVKFSLTGKGEIKDPFLKWGKN